MRRLLRTRNKRYLIAFLLYGVNLYFAQSRTGYIAFFLLVLYVLVKERLRLVIRPHWLFVSASFALLFYISGERVHQRLTRVAEASMFVDLDINNAVTARNNVARIAYLASVVEIAKRTPVLGVGLGIANYEKNMPSYYRELIRVYSATGVASNPYNFYASLLVSTGGWGTLSDAVVS